MSVLTFLNNQLSIIILPEPEVRPPENMQIVDEYYHVYNRGAHKAPIFNDPMDYDRFLCLLYLANSPERFEFREIECDIFKLSRLNTLVDIHAYCLMPNHFHLALHEIKECGIERFMKKLCTAYVMYYNLKYNHSGTIFQGKYKFKHVDTPEYWQYLLEYIHLNPFGIEEPELLKEVRRELRDQAIEYSKKYIFSSFRDYLGEKRPQGVILNASPEVRPPEII